MSNDGQPRRMLVRYLINNTNYNCAEFSFYDHTAIQSNKKIKQQLRIQILKFERYLYEASNTL